MFHGLERRQSDDLPNAVSTADDRGNGGDQNDEKETRDGNLAADGEAFE